MRLCVELFSSKKAKTSFSIKPSKFTGVDIYTLKMIIGLEVKSFIKIAIMKLFLIKQINIRLDHC